MEQQPIGLRRRDPLQVKQVAVGEPEPCEGQRMLERLDGEAVGATSSARDETRYRLSSTTNPSATGTAPKRNLDVSSRTLTPCRARAAASA